MKEEEEKWSNLRRRGDKVNKEERRRENKRLRRREGREKEEQRGKDARE